MKLGTSVWLASMAALACSRPASQRQPSPDKPAALATEEVTRAVFETGEQRLVIEALDGDMVRFELHAASQPYADEQGFFETPMIAPDAGRPVVMQRRGRVIDTGQIRIEVAEDLCLSVRRLSWMKPLRMCPSQADGTGSLRLWPEPGARAYGLGQVCTEPGESGGDWSGRIRKPGNRFGNRMVDFDGGACGNTQIPILYVHDRGTPWALFMDDVRAQTWSLDQEPWRVDSSGDAVRGYILSGNTLSEVRADYLELTGRPPVPPRAAFGLWVSEYGYDDWDEAIEVVKELRKAAIPVDGVVLDLQWFGGIREDSDQTQMGTLTFDPKAFPDPGARIAELRERHGVEVILIEESYVGRGLGEHRGLADKGFLATLPSGQPVYLHDNPWWGKGGMIDWSNPAAGDFWHDQKRKPLVDLGVAGHWTDLGEPEQYDPQAVYHGFDGIGKDQAAVHNLYNLAWADSIARGYQRHGETRRPFILTRSGTAGIQRFGAALWSGDLGSRFSTLANQQRNRMHMALSGIDYYGSDVGGFRREVLPDGQSIDELYTMWLVNAALSEVPLRPHTYNLDERYETSPARIGDVKSNRAAVRLRYQLVPYLYSLAHRAHEKGEAVFPPLLMHYPEDPIARQLGDHLLIGRDLLAVMLHQPGQTQARVYLPRGTWYDFYDHTRIDSTGQWIEVPVWREGLFRAPLFARAGAIIPMAAIDDKTRNTQDLSSDMRIRVYPSPGQTSFEVVEDDGQTTAYLDGRTSRMGLTAEHGGAFIGLHQTGSAGDRKRRVAFELVLGPDDRVSRVVDREDGEIAPSTLDRVAAGANGWAQDGVRLLVRTSGVSAPAIRIHLAN